MGMHENIDHDKFPEQGSFLNKQVLVCFSFDTTVTINGKIVRDDKDDPYVLIIALNDGRYVLSTECQFRLM